jgi:signal transduction histidine kinase
VSIKLKLIALLLLIGLVPTFVVGLVAYLTISKSQEAFASIDELRNSLTAISIFLAVIITVVAFYLAKLFTEPILRIAKAAKLMGTGDFSTHLEMQRKDEFGALAQNINAMGLDLKEFVTSLQSQRNRLEIILDSTEECILALDPQGVIIIANKATTALTRKTIGDVVGKHMSDIFVWMRSGQPYPINYDAHGTQKYVDLQYTDFDGVLHYTELVVARVGYMTNEAQTIITIHDQTKSRELENMKLDFVSMAAHELRTPLATIRGYLELVSLKGAQSDAAESEQYIQQALKSSSDLSGLITNLLDVTKIERDALTLTMEKIDLAATVAQAVKNVRFSANDKQQTVTYSGPESECFIAADPIPLREVINNLLGNAIKYTGPGGKIDVTLTTIDKGYKVDVKDNGMGIPKDSIPNLFTKFYRVDSGLDSSSGGGTGLGLFLTKSIIERHNGTISVESKEGEGSTFSFTLPLFSDEQFAEMQQEKGGDLESTRRNHGWSTKNIDR